eukprot:182684_1
MSPPKTLPNDNNNINSNENEILPIQIRCLSVDPHINIYTIPPTNPLTDQNTDAHIDPCATKNSKNDKIYCNQNDAQYTIYKTYNSSLNTNTPIPYANPTTDRSKDPITASRTPQIPHATLVHEKLNGKIHTKIDSNKIGQKLYLYQKNIIESIYC